jgi:hypothetical protein
MTFIWLAVKDRCWTANRLANRGLPHPARCPLCDQDEESIQHLLVSCVLARQVWTEILQRLGLVTVAPQPSVTRFSSWWCLALKNIPKEMRKGFNSLVILVAWEIWKHWNECLQWC